MLFLFSDFQEQIHSVSRRTAESIVEVYPTIRSLVSIYNSDGLTLEQKKMLLQDLPIQGKGGQRRLGPSLSEKIFTIFTTTDGSKVISDK